MAAANGGAVREGQPITQAALQRFKPPILGLTQIYVWCFNWSSFKPSAKARFAALTAVRLLANDQRGVRPRTQPCLGLLQRGTLLQRPLCKVEDAGVGVLRELVPVPPARITDQRALIMSAFSPSLFLYLEGVSSLCGGFQQNCTPLAWQKLPSRATCRH